MTYSFKKISICSYLGISISILLWIMTIGCNSTGPDSSPWGLNEKLHYNEVSIKMTHNSYIEDNGDIFNKTECLDRAKGTIESQLEFDPARPWASASGVELDIWTVDGWKNSQTGEYEFEWEVKHAGGIDDRTWPKFSDYLKRLEAWSRAHPGHNVITVKIEEKWFATLDNDLGELLAGTKFPDFPSKNLGFDGSGADAYWYFYVRVFIPNFPKCLDAYIAKHFDTNLLYTPKQLKGSAPTLLAGANNGWPTLDALKGKFIFYVMGADAAQDYAGDTPEARLCFQRNNNINDENSVFLSVSGESLIGDGLEKSTKAINRIKDYHEQQPAKIIATYLGHHHEECGGLFNIYGLPKPIEDAQDWAAARALGVNLIQSDVVNKKWASLGTKEYWPIPKSYWGDWQNISAQNGASTSSSPGIIEFQDKLYIFYTNVNNVGRYFTYNGTAFTGSTSITSSVAVRELRPGVVVYKNELWVFYLAKDSDNIIYDTFDGRYWHTWSIPHGVWSTIPSVSTTRAPGVAVLDGKLWVVYPDKSGTISFVTYNGSSWSAPKTAAGKTCAEVGVCARDNKLHLFYRGVSSESVYMGTIDASGNPGPETNIDAIIGFGTCGAPAVAVANGQIEVLARSCSSNLMYGFSVDKDGDISGATKMLTGSTSHSPALAVYGSELVAVVVGNNGGSLYYNSRQRY